MSSKSKKRQKEKAPVYSLFRKEALDEKGQRLFGEVIIIQPLTFRVLTYLLFIILVVALLFLFLGSYSKKETVNGYLMPDKGISKIFIPGGGVVSRVFVKEGQKVTVGDPLLSITQERVLNSGGGVETQLIQFLNDQIALTQTQIEEEHNQAAIRERQLNNDIKTLELEMVQLKNRLVLQIQITADAKKTLDIAEGLADQGYVTQLDLTQRRNAYHNSQGTEALLKQQVEQTQNALKSKKSDLEANPGLSRTTITQLKSRLSDLQQRLAETESKRAYTVTAPVSGRISGHQAFPGMTTNPAQPLMTVLPEDSAFEAELFVPTRAIGLIKPGQEVRIFYDAFSYQNFGTYAGTISEISKTILSPSEISGPLTPAEPVYRVVAKLERQEVSGFGETFPLQAGMTLQAVVVLERQTFFEMLLEPLKALKGRT